MHLKALELTGFKSFADKTIIEFNKGITSIVGPNGSGKSNILDAILWVLGEQSYKNIRAKESSDVIFSGGKNKKAKSMAEVSLIVENEDRFLDIDFSEVKITRRIYKNGENEYFINNRKTRLKDINSLFMDTGIGKQAYSIIGQGKVERIISSNPKELKEIIEEAAGVKRAKTEKEESLKKLKEIKNEVEKISYVEKDLEIRVNYLKEEGMKAKLFKTYSEKIETNKLMILEYNINQSEILKASLENEKNKIEEEISNIQRDFDEKKNKLESINRASGEMEKNLENEKNKNVDVFSKMEELKMDFSNLKNKLSNLETEANEKNKRKNVVEEELEEKKLTLEKSQREFEEIENEFKKIEIEKNEIEIKVENLKLKKNEILNNLKGKKEENQNFEVDKIKLSHENQDLEKRIFTAQNENKRLLTEFERIKNEFLNIEENKKEIENRKNFYEKEKSLIEDDKQNIVQSVKTLNEGYFELNKEINKINYEFEKIQSKKRAVENIIENNETFYKGVKYLLNEKIEGVIGAFINLIDIPIGYESAYQTLAGSSFQDIVVSEAVIGQKAIEILKEKKLGRASFLPLDSIKIFKIDDKLPKLEGVIDFARNLIGYNSEIKKVIDFVFGNSVIVENLEVGRKLLKNGFSDRIVTLEGDIITARGRMTGGYIQKGKDELIERKKELKLLEENINNLASKKSMVQKKIDEIKIKLEKGEKVKREKEKKYFEFDQEYREFLSKYENFNIHFNRKENEIKTLNYEIEENENSINMRKNKLKSNISTIEKLEMDIISNLKIVEDLEKNLKEVDDLSDYNEKLNSIKMEYEILKVKTEGNRKRFFEIQGDYEKLSNEKNEIINFEMKKNEIKKVLEVEILDKKEKIDKKIIENENLNIEIRNLENKIKELEKTEKTFITEIKDIEVKMIGSKSEKERVLDRLNKNIKDLEYYKLQLEELNVDKIMSSEEYKKIESELELQNIKRKLSMNEKSKMDLGSVNLSSIDEYERESLRYNDLIDQKRDLINSRESLMDFIRDIEREIIDKFSKAFDEINKNFEYMCRKILNEAKGTIKMTNSEDILETGLELSVKYKNKPEQTLLLLSGGEKSMLAVSFIMAIFMYKPSPFTFFDEIEAALDESNTQKIIELLNKFIEKSQFILITHNKETMKGSHRLYGVTMNKEIGESRLISVDV